MQADAEWRRDALARTREDYAKAGGKPSNTYYGFVRALKEEGGRNAS